MEETLGSRTQYILFWGEHVGKNGPIRAGLIWLKQKRASNYSLKTPEDGLELREELGDSQAAGLGNQ